MVQFRKAILKTGTYHSPDGKVEVTPDRLQHWASEFRRMKAASQVVPVDWDHAVDAADMQPMSLSDFDQRSAARGIGRLEEFRVAPDGQSAEVWLDVRQPRAIEAANLNTCYVSPVLFPQWRDGAGNAYRDCITHVDFVHHPVDHSQGPFAPVEPGAIACCLRMGLDSQVYAFQGAQRMAEESTKPEDDVLDDAPPEDTTDDAAATDTAPSGSTLKDVVETLKQFNIVLQDGTTAENLLDRLHAALLTAAAHQGKGDEPEEPEGDDPGAATVVQDPTVATMSLETRAVIDHAQRQHRAAIGERLDRLCGDGRCTPFELKTWQEKLPAVRLSLDAAGKPEVSEVEQFIEHRNAVPRGTFWDDETRTRMSSVIEPPDRMTKEPDEDQIQSTVDWALGRGKRK
jgi:hypothetical protein